MEEVERRGAPPKPAGADAPGELPGLARRAGRTQGGRVHRQPQFMHQDRGNDIDRIGEQLKRRARHGAGKVIHAALERLARSALQRRPRPPQTRRRQTPPHPRPRPPSVCPGR